MAYDKSLASRVRHYLSELEHLAVTEKGMFGGLAFLVNGKMCVNVSGDRLMCRFDPELIDEIAERTGFEPMIMRNKQYNGYCYVEPIGYERTADFNFWMQICIAYNSEAKPAKKGRR